APIVPVSFQSPARGADGASPSRHGRAGTRREIAASSRFGGRAREKAGRPRDSLKFLPPRLARAPPGWNASSVPASTLRPGGAVAGSSQGRETMKRLVLTALLALAVLGLSIGEAHAWGKIQFSAGFNFTWERSGIVLNSAFSAAPASFCGPGCGYG